MLVVVVLFLFLGSVRTTLISALAIPLSLVAAVVVLSAFGLHRQHHDARRADDRDRRSWSTTRSSTSRTSSAACARNTGGRTRGRSARRWRRRPPKCVSPILFATLIIILVFLPIFFLPGLEGRLLEPLGLAFVTALAASLLVALTVTPVLCALLLGSSRALETKEPWLLRAFQAAYRPTLAWCLGHRRWVIAATAVAVAAALAVVPGLGRSFLPPFNEGSLTVSVVSPPGIPLAESDRLGRQVEEALLVVPRGGVDQPAHRPRREGRARPGRQRLRDGGRPRTARPGPRQGGAAGGDAAGGRRRPGRLGLLRPADQPPDRSHDLGQQDQPRGQGLRARPRRSCAASPPASSGRSPECRGSSTSRTRSRRRSPS